MFNRRNENNMVINMTAEDSIFAVFFNYGLEVFYPSYPSDSFNRKTKSRFSSSNFSMIVSKFLSMLAI